MVVPYEPLPELAALSPTEIAELVAARKLPPVDQWSPAREGDSLMRIAADGSWTHDGGAITRPAMVRAFASLLTRDGDGRHWLVTPHERLSIEVEDAAFIATDVKAADGSLVFLLNTDDLVVAGPKQPLVARGDPDTPRLYLDVRNGAEARLNRSTWLQLVELADADLKVTSQGATFSLVPR